MIKLTRRSVASAAAVLALGAGGTAWAATSARASASSLIPRCAAGDLAVWLNASEAEGAAGSVGYPLEFTNIGHVTCYLEGYPGVSAAGASGKQLGNAAGKNPAFKTTKVALFPGNTAHADLTWADVLNFPASKCKPAASSLLKVFAPNAKHYDLAFATPKACSVKGETYLFTSSVQPGPNSE